MFGPSLTRTRLWLFVSPKMPPNGLLGEDRAADGKRGNAVRVAVHDLLAASRWPPLVPSPLALAQ